MAPETDKAIAKLFEAVARLEEKVDLMNQLLQAKAAADATLRHIIYGDGDSLGMLGKQRVTETRLQVLWWAISITGAATITALVQVFSKA